MRWSTKLVLMMAFSLVVAGRGQAPERRVLSKAGLSFTEGVSLSVAKRVSVAPVPVPLALAGWYALMPSLG